MCLQRKPKTIEEMLKRIGLQQYVGNLVDNGFDEIEFLEDLTDQNLFEAGIFPSDHRAKVHITLNNIQLSISTF